MLSLSGSVSGITGVWYLKGLVNDTGTSVAIKAELFLKGILQIARF